MDVKHFTIVLCMSQVFASANAFGQNPAPQDPAPRKMSMEEFLRRQSRSPCSGDACSKIKLELLGGCLWAKNSSPQKVMLRFEYESRATQVVLEAADPVKAAERQSLIDRLRKNRETAAQDYSERRKCERLLAFERVKAENPKPGLRDIATPEARRKLATCTQLLAQPREAAPDLSAQTSYHEQLYEPLSQLHYGAVFATKLAHAEGCFTAQSSKYSANFVPPEIDTPSEKKASAQQEIEFRTVTPQLNPKDPFGVWQPSRGR